MGYHHKLEEGYLEYAWLRSVLSYFRVRPTHYSQTRFVPEVRWDLAFFFYSTRISDCVARCVATRCNYNPLRSSEVISVRLRT